VKKKQTRNKVKNRKISLTTNEKNALVKAQKSETKTQILKRIQSILLKDKGWTHKAIAEHLGKGLGTISGWLELYEKEKLAGLLSWQYGGKKGKLSDEQIKQVKKRIHETPFSIAQEAVDFIKKEFKIDYHAKYMPRLLKKITYPGKSPA
jgi:transposase